MNTHTKNDKKHASKAHNSKKTERKGTTMNNDQTSNQITEETSIHAASPIETSTAPAVVANTQVAHEAPATDLVLAPDPREESAFEQMRPLAMALATKDIMQVNLDPGAVAFIASGVAEKMIAYRDAMTRLPNFDIASLDTLQTSALALSLAQSDYLVATTPKDSLPELADRAAKLQAEFEAWVPGLAFAGLIDATRFDGLRAPIGFRDRVVTLNAYVRAFKSSDWAAIKAKSTLTDATISEAELVCQRMFAIVGRRDTSPAKIAAATDVRARLFTLCVTRYDQIRRATMFLRWEEGDADVLVPSLYLKGPRSKSQNGPDAPNGGNTTNGTSNSNNAPAAPVGPPIVSVSEAHVATPAAAPHAEVPSGNGHVAEVGMPDSPPFKVG